MFRKREVLRDVIEWEPAGFGHLAELQRHVGNRI